jgi:hypothetical protein
VLLQVPLNMDGGTPRIPLFKWGGAVLVPAPVPPPPPPPPPPLPPAGAVVFIDIDERVIVGKPVKRLIVCATGEFDWLW